MMGRRERRCKQLLDYLNETRGYWKIERGNTTSYAVENLLKKRLWTCRKTDYRVNKFIPKKPSATLLPPQLASSTVYRTNSDIIGNSNNTLILAQAACL